MTDKKTDEPAVVQVIAGPYAGQRLTMPKADADAAIADKWATDPNAPPRSKDEEEKEAREAKPMTEEERAEVKAKAEKAARKLRGEPELDAKPEEKARGPERGPDDPHTYQTRDLTRK